ncbi:MAG: hypothetical protein WCL32_00125 [Planctomycetota bacterium]
MSATFTLLTAGLLVTQSAAPAPTCNCQKNQATVISQSAQPIQLAANEPSPGLFRGLFRSKTEDAPAPAPAPAEDRPILSRLQGLFGGKKDESVTTTTGEPPIAQSTTATPVRPMQRMPAGQPTRTNSLAIPEPLPPAPIKVQPVTYKAVPISEAGSPTAAQVSSPAAPVAVPASAGQTVVAPPSRPNRISSDLVGKVGHESDYSWITGQIHIENGVHVLHYATPETVDAYNGSLVLVSSLDLRSFQDGDFVSVRGQVSGSGNRVSYRLSSIDRLPR